MKKNMEFLAIILLISSLVFITCNDDGGNESIPMTFENLTSTGHQLTITADGVSFTMIYVPGNIQFPTGVNDDSTETIANAYWIGETEVTYELWRKIYIWATDPLRGTKQYTFANAGTMGDGTSDSVSLHSNGNFYRLN